MRARRSSLEKRIDDVQTDESYENMNQYWKARLKSLSFQFGFIIGFGLIFALAALYVLSSYRPLTHAIDRAELRVLKSVTHSHMPHDRKSVHGEPRALSMEKA